MSLCNNDSILAEDVDITLLNEQDQVTICEGNYCVKMFVDDYIRDQFKNIAGKGLRFRI